MHLSASHSFVGFFIDSKDSYAPREVSNRMAKRNAEDCWILAVTLLATQSGIFAFRLYLVDLNSFGHFLRFEMVEKQSKINLENQ